MLKAGTFLQNRYEIISRIGSGGMADVYRAKDHKLNRFVAIKVLKPEFKDDRVFLSKFRVEAQAAAGLAHANIVNVFDVGEENGISFIVMELVEGITLKAYIGKKGKLPVREATSIALQVAAGLEVAHNNGIIHRDVKPQNIIISMDGKAKVADFGIARAVSSNTINSSAMGSVHYSSPEQSRGGYSDAKSDIYSMGITMYEMITGRVPFDGENTVAVALKHLQEEIPSPRKLVPDIPFSTEQIILKCTQKSPDRRYNNMTELIRDLKESLVNPEGNFVSISKLDNKAHTILISKEEINQIKNGSMPVYDETLSTGAAESFSDSGNVTGDNRSYPYGGNYYQNSGYQELKYNQGSYPNQSSNPGSYPNQNSYPPNQNSYPDPRFNSYSAAYQERMNYPGEEPDNEFDYEQEEYKHPGKYRGARLRQSADEDGMSSGTERLITVISIIAAVIIGCAILAFLGRSFGLLKLGNTSQTESIQGESSLQQISSDKVVKVPDLLGKTEAEAQKLLRDSNLGYKYQGESASNEYAKGLVIRQTVEADSSVEKNTTVGYIISSGSSETLTVPTLTNVSMEDAEKALTSMGLNVYVDNSRYSDTVNKGNIITTNPGAGSSVKVGDTVTIYVSQGTETSLVAVPQVVGHYVDDASTTLNNLGLYVYITEVTSSDVQKGIVMAQDIAENTYVQTGTVITITVSAGSPDPEIVINPQGRWMCNAQLQMPSGYNGEPVRIELVQNGVTTPIFEGTTTFPFLLNVEGQAGVPDGTAYVYTLDPQTWTVTSTTSYEGIIFSQVD